LLTGQRPFRAKNRDELLDLIATRELRPPRQLDDTIPKELDRICLKALGKRASDRYSTAIDLAEDLRHWQSVSSELLIPNLPVTAPVIDFPPSCSGTTLTADSLSGGSLIQVVPKGLRSFEAEDADFFLDLLPGPSGRDGLPESIQFWKTRLEETDPDKTFRVGLIYGPSFQGITTIHRGSNQVLAQLRLPKTVEDTPGDYVLHPSLMDSALQAAVGLIDGLSELSNEPRLPFALESLRIVSVCTPEMVAWVRYSPGSQAADKVVKLDIDLCSERGDICVQMHGFSSRVPSKEIDTAAAQGQAIGSLFATPVWHASGVEVSAAQSNIEYTEHHVILCELSKVDSIRLGGLVSRSLCLSLNAGQQENIAQRYSEYALACFERIQALFPVAAVYDRRESAIDNIRRSQTAATVGKVLVQIVVADHQEQALLAGLSGLLKTAALENPQFIGQLIFVPVHTTAEELAKWLQGEQPRRLDTLIRYDEQGGRHVSRWEVVSADPETSPIAFKDHGVYLITGGLGGLGVLFAREILDQTREARVVLTGRSALSPEKRRLVDGLSTKSGQLSYRQVDLGNLDQVEQHLPSVAVRVSLRCLSVDSEVSWAGRRPQSVAAIGVVGPAALDQNIFAEAINLAVVVTLRRPATLGIGNRGVPRSLPRERVGTETMPMPPFHPSA